MTDLIEIISSQPGEAEPLSERFETYLLDSLFRYCGKWAVCIHYNHEKERESYAAYFYKHKSRWSWKIDAASYYRQREGLGIRTTHKFFATRAAAIKDCARVLAHQDINSVLVWSDEMTMFGDIIPDRDEAERMLQDMHHRMIEMIQTQEKVKRLPRYYYRNFI